MMGDSSAREGQVRLFEHEAEILATYQLDLLAQLEQQIRAVHDTMRHIEKLRGSKDRVGPELSNGQREFTLASLAADVANLEAHLNTEHDCCTEMLATIAQMCDRLALFRDRLAGAE